MQAKLKITFTLMMYAAAILDFEVVAGVVCLTLGGVPVEISDANNAVDNNLQL